MTLSEAQIKQYDDYYLPAPVACPACNSADNVQRLIVGRPTPELQEYCALRGEKVATAGCAAQDDNGKMITHKCTSCDNKFSNQ